MSAAVDSVGSLRTAFVDAIAKDGRRSTLGSLDTVLQLALSVSSSVKGRIDLIIALPDQRSHDGGQDPTVAVLYLLSVLLFLESSMLLLCFVVPVTPIV